MQGEKRVLYVGLDASQYSSKGFQNSDYQSNEICVGIFSENPFCLETNKFSRKRNINLLDYLDQDNLFSASLTIKENPNDLRLGNLPYSSVSLVDYFLNMHNNHYDSIELHFDGTIHCHEFRFITSKLKERFSKVIIRSHKKKMKTDSKTKQKYYSQPFLVGLTDCLANYLFKKHPNSLLMGLSSEESTNIPIELKDNTFNHHHLWGIN